MFTNDASLELLRNLNKPSFEEKQIAGFGEETAVLIRKNEAYLAAHPGIGIYRLATEGSQTRNGGEIQKASSPLRFTLRDGAEVRVARKGDSVVYPDGSTAQILTGAGLGYSDIALVGSRLSNGDEIINTPQGTALLVKRMGVQMADDFLPVI